MKTGMAEFELIEEAFRRHTPSCKPQTRIANGDDGSVHGISPDQELVVSTDASVSGVHWPLDMPLEKAADRAVCAALSDLAAMGAEAYWLWVSVLACSASDAACMGRGIHAALWRYTIELAGGDTVSAPVNALSLTVAGILPQGTAMRRNAASPGDDLWLCGAAGHAALGLRQWQSGHRDGVFVERFAEVKPLLAEGKSLREKGVRCCIDVSDGLLQDAGHIARASGLAMRIDVEALPGWQELLDVAGPDDAKTCAMTGGEDYALLFTAPHNLRPILKPVGKRFGICKEGTGVQAAYHGRLLRMPIKGYAHFS